MSDTINVPNYPLSNLVPGFFFDIDPSNANTGTQAQRTLIIGQLLSGGTWTPGVPVLAVGPTDINPGSGGPKSMIARMIARYQLSDPLGEIWVLPLSDDGAATATVETVTITGPATASGAISIMIAGIDVQVPVLSGATAAQMSTAMAAAINGVPNMPCTAAAAGTPPYAVTLTASNAGLAAGDLDVRLNYYGSQGGEQLPAGVAVALATTTQGATNPSTALTSAVANLGVAPFDFIICPYTDTTSLNLMDTLLDPVTGRWSWSQQIYGGVFTAYRGTVGQRVSFASARDDKFVSAIGFYNAPNPAYEWAADYGAACAASLRVNPALPLGGAGDGVNLTILPPPVQSRDIFASQQTLLSSGVSTYLVEQGGTVRVQRAVNIYTTNAAGQPDSSFRDVETNYTLMACIRDLLTSLTSQFGRKILVADGTPIAGGSAAVTSQTILQAVIARYRVQCSNFLAQNPSTFAAAAQGTNAGNGTVLLYLPYQIANQLRVVAGSVAFSKP